MAKARDVGVNSIVLFPKVPDALKVLTHLNYFEIFTITSLVWNMSLVINLLSKLGSVLDFHRR